MKLEQPNPDVHTLRLRAGTTNTTLSQSHPERLGAQWPDRRATPGDVLTAQARRGTTQMRAADRALGHEGVDMGPIQGRFGGFKIRQRTDQVATTGAVKITHSDIITRQYELIHDALSCSNDATSASLTSPKTEHGHPSGTRVIPTPTHDAPSVAPLYVRAHVMRAAQTSRSRVMRVMDDPK